MKKALLLFLPTLLNIIDIFAQAPQSFKYQAIARNSSGVELANTNLNVRVSIHDLSAGGSILYQETFSVTTNQFGLFNLNIGGGLPAVGTFTAIPWGSGSKFIEQEIDFGNGYQSMGTSQLLSVPYALYAEKSGSVNGWSLTGNAGTADTVNFIGTTDYKPLNFRVNNHMAGRIDADQNKANTFFGYEAGNANTTGALNTIYGQKAFHSNSSGFCNTVIGSHALFSNTFGYWNTVTGYYTMYFNTTGKYNTANGCWALGQNTSGNYNTADGMNALERSKTGSFNTATGFASLSSNSTGDNNTAVGYGALCTNYTGSDNTALGHLANVSHTNLTNATAIGANAIVSASNCLVLGSINGINGATSDVNVGIGTTAPSAKLEVSGQVKITGGSPGAGKVLTSDAVGLASWQNLSSTSATSWAVTGNAGTVDTINFIGTTDSMPLNFRVNNRKAGKIEMSFPFNTFFGYQAGNTNTTGYYNYAGGWRALYSNTTGAFNIAIGPAALISNTTGSENVAIGTQALNSNASGQQNIAIGPNALSSNISGSYNTAVGNAALIQNSSGKFNVAYGNGTLYQNTTGHSNTASGYGALWFNITGSSNVAVGVSALYNSRSISNLVAIGDSALYNNGPGMGMTGALANTAVGSKASFSNTSGSDNTATGYKTLYLNSTGVRNTALGSQALYNNKSSENTAIGYQALYWNVNGYENTAIGPLSLANNTDGIYNIGIGTDVLYNNTIGNGNVALGNGALGNNISGSNNTAIGAHAYATSATSYSNSTALGSSTPITASNQVRVGDASVTSIGGQVGWTTLSDGRFKKNISENVPGLSFITKLRPIVYHLDPNEIASFLKIPDSLRSREAETLRSSMLETGFIAQEVEKAAKDLGYDFSGVDKPKNDNDYYGLRYAEFVVPLVKGMQEQQAMIEELKKEIAQLKKLTQELQNSSDKR